MKRLISLIFVVTLAGCASDRPKMLLNDLSPQPISTHVARAISYAYSDISTIYSNTDNLAFAFEISEDNIYVYFLEFHRSEDPVSGNFSSQSGQFEPIIGYTFDNEGHFLRRRGVR